MNVFYEQLVPNNFMPIISLVYSVMITFFSAMVFYYYYFFSLFDTIRTVGSFRLYDIWHCVGVHLNMN